MEMLEKTKSISTIAILRPVKAIFEKRAATVEVDTFISPEESLGFWWVFLAFFNKKTRKGRTGHIGSEVERAEQTLKSDGVMLQQVGNESQWKEERVRLSEIRAGSSRHQVAAHEEGPSKLPNP